MAIAKTTTNLKLPTRPRWLDHIPMPLLILTAVLVTAAGISTVNRIQITPSAIVVPTPSLPIVIIQKEAAVAVPVAMPAQQVAQPAPVRYRGSVCFS
jgi:hypothetical protein